MDKKERINAIQIMIYESLDYMYCDNCRFNGEMTEDQCEKENINWGCEDCHRKYNGWGISKHEANRLAKQIEELINQ